MQMPLKDFRYWLIIHKHNYQNFKLRVFHMHITLNEKDSNATQNGLKCVNQKQLLYSKLPSGNIENESLRCHDDDVMVT